MHLSLPGLVSHARTEEASKWLRYCGVSTVFVPLGQIAIQVFGFWLDSYTAASLLSAAVVTIPNFFANKNFVWRVTSRENLRRQMLVFWVAMMLGVALATFFTHVVENVMADHQRLSRGAFVFLAQLGGYGIVWVGRFLLLERWLFRPSDNTQSHRAPLVDEECESKSSSHTRAVVSASLQGVDTHGGFEALMPPSPRIYLWRGGQRGSVWRNGFSQCVEEVVD